jgi:NAD(P)H-hydrate epimerase
VCCGSGNNAGDGFVIARHLDLRGIKPRVLLWAAPDELKGDALANYTVISRSGMAVEQFDEAADPVRLQAALQGVTWIVDALLGTGARGAPRPPLDAVIQQLNDHPAPVLAVDVPSGLDCETGDAADMTIRAAHTCTFVALKSGFVAPGADRCTGKVHVLDIGAPRCLVEEVLGQQRTVTE